MSTNSVIQYLRSAFSFREFEVNEDKSVDFKAILNRWIVLFVLIAVPILFTVVEMIHAIAPLITYIGLLLLLMYLPPLLMVKRTKVILMSDFTITIRESRVDTVLLLRAAGRALAYLFLLSIGALFVWR